MLCIYGPWPTKQSLVWPLSTSPTVNSTFALQLVSFSLVLKYIKLIPLLSVFACALHSAWNDFSQCGSLHDSFLSFSLTSNDPFSKTCLPPSKMSFPSQCIICCLHSTYRHLKLSYILFYHLFVFFLSSTV